MAEEAANLLLGSKLCLWRKITSISQPSKLVEYDLDSNLKAIHLGVLPYEKKRCATSGKKLTSLQIGSSQKKLLDELSDLLDMDQLVCHELFTSWLLSEFRSDGENLKAGLADERSRYNLVTQLVSFYYSDRLYSLLTLKHVMGYSHDSNHSHQTIYSSFVKKLESECNGDLCQHLLNIYETLADKEPRLIYDSPVRYLQTSEYLSSWCYQILKEQILVLEILLLHVFYQDAVEFNTILQLMNSFKTRALTGKPSLAIKHLLGEIHQPLLERLEQLQVFIVLASMKLADDGDTTETRLDSGGTAGDGSIVEKLDGLFSTRMGGFQSHGPLLLGWAAFRLGQTSNELIAKLGDAALSLDALSYLYGCIRDLNVEDLSNQIIVLSAYHLVSKVITLFDDSCLDDSNLICKLISSILRSRAVCDMIVEAGEDDSIYMYIQAALHTFPLSLHSVVEMISVLAASSKSTAALVVGLLVELPTYAEYLDASSQYNLQLVTDTEVELLENRHLYGTTYLPAHAIGLMSDRDGTAIIQWQFSFNGWELLSHKLSSMTSQPYQVADVNAQNEILSITRLMAATFKHAAISGEPSVLINESLYRILYGLSALEEPPLNIISSCIDLSTSIVAFNPYPALENLSVLFLPNITHVESDCKLWEAEIDRSVFGHILYGVECVQARYPVLISTLKLVCAALNHQSDKRIRSCLTPVVLYIIRDIFVSYVNWRYTDLFERDQISELCAEIVHHIINHPNSSNEDGLSQVCVQSLLHTNSGQILLNMISLGADILDLIALEQYSLPVMSCLDHSGKFSSAIYRLRLCLSLVKRLLVIALAFEGETVLESGLASKSATSGSNQLTRTIAHYTYHRHHLKIAILSTQVLNVIAQETQMSLLSSFGDEGSSIKSGFLRRLASRSEDPRFKVVVIELITTCVQKQPGVLELFLTDNQEEESLLKIIQSLMETEKQFTHICPGELLLACLNFILALWSAGREKVTQQLSKDKSFWEMIISPLKKKIGDLRSGSVTHPLKAKIYCNILEIIAYQLYIRDESNKAFTETFNSTEQTVWVDISQFVRVLLADSNVTIDDDHVSADLTLRQVSTVRLLDSYRMFISTVHMFSSSTFKEDTCAHVMSDVLSSLLQLSSTYTTGSSTQQVLASMLSSMYAELLGKWIRSVKSWETAYADLSSILHHLTSGGCDIELIPNVLLGVILSIRLLTNRKLRLPSKAENLKDASDSIFHSVINLLPTACRQLDAMTTYDSIEYKRCQKLRLSLMLTLYEIINQQTDSNWVSRLHESCLLQALMMSTSHCIKVKRDLHFCEIMTTILAYLAKKIPTAQLISSLVVEHLMLSVSSLYTPSEKTSEGEGCEWKKISVRVTNIYSCLLKTLAHTFVSNAATYVAVNSDRIYGLIENLMSNLNLDEVHEIASYVHLLSVLCNHKHQWICETSSGSVNQLIAAVCYLNQYSLTLLQKPKVIKHMILRQRTHLVQNESSVDISDMRQGLLNVMSECCLCMKQVTPDLCLLFTDVTFDAMSHQPLVSFSFTPPSLGNQAPPSFGTLTSITSLCIGMLTKGERSPSRGHLSDDEVEQIRPRLLYTLEITLYIIMSQVLLYLRSGSLAQKEIGVLKREISTELNSCLLGMQRYFRRLSPASPSRGSQTPSPAPAGSSKPMVSPRGRSIHSPNFTSPHFSDHGLFKLADQFVKQVLK